MVKLHALYTLSVFIIWTVYHFAGQASQSRLFSSRSDPCEICSADIEPAFVPGDRLFQILGVAYNPYFYCTPSMMAPRRLARTPSGAESSSDVTRRICIQLPQIFLMLLFLCRPCHPVLNGTRGNVTPGSAVANTNKLLPSADPETPTKSTNKNVSMPKNSSQVIINTKQGRMGGIAVDVGGETTTRFLGVPYAAPPVGKLRFKPPKKHAWKSESGWSFRQTWNATKPRPACPRELSAWRYPFSLDSLYGDMVSKTETSEDCLYLNIFIPRNLSKVEHVNTLSFPVMVYIHDGNLRTEHSVLRNAWRFSRSGNVIVATVSFRVGVLGYLSLKHDSAPGNYGLMDQSLALHWIWDNIREFGGDPAKITLFGSSLGGIDVGYHVISPQSRGLFVRAISMSGSMLSRCCRQKQPAEAATALARHLKCKVVPRTAMIECLRKASINHLMQAAMKTAEQFGNWWPIIDGNFIPDEPLRLLENNKFSPVDYIIGMNSHDGYQIIKDMHIDLDRDVSNDGFEDLVHQSVAKYFHNNIERATRALLTEYHFCAQNRTQLGGTYVDFLTDMEYVSPAVLAARYLSRNTNRKVFLYEFAHRSSYTLSTRPGFIVAHHLDELEYVTGDVKYVLANVTEEERSLSAAIMSAWANFATNG